MNKIRCVFPKCGKMVRSGADYEVHISYCRLQWNIHFKSCPFNKAHVVSEIEMERHLECCPDKEVVENFFHSVWVRIEDERASLANDEVDVNEGNWRTGGGILRTAKVLPEIGSIEDLEKSSKC